MVPIDDSARTSLRALEDARGRLDPVEVVAEARKASSPLHDHFTWDDTAAAAERRLDQAQSLIRRIHIEVETSSKTIDLPAYVARVKSVGYVSIVKMPNDDREAAMIRELIALRGVARRVAALATAWERRQIKQRLTTLCTWIDNQIDEEP